MDLEIETLVVSPFQQNCRVVRDRVTGEGVVIDPGDEAERIVDVVERSHMTVRYVLATHAHLDHIGAAQEVVQALGVPFVLHGADTPILDTLPEHARMFGVGDLEAPQVDIDLQGRETLDFAGGSIRVLATPGHTPGGVTFLFGRHGFFGDTLFMGSVGRTDLGGDARVYARTLEEVVLPLPDDTVVHCGHGPDTTIGRERTSNPFLTGQIRLS